MPLFSVVIPCFNVQEYIEQCIDSVVKQDKGDIEIICIDDGSTDSTLKILRQYESRIDRFKLFLSENAGPGRCRNTGMDHADGEHLLFLDSDDYLSAGLFDELRTIVSNENAPELITFGYRLLDSEEVLFERIEKKLTPESILTCANNLSPWAKCYSSMSLKALNIKFRDDVKVEDIDFVVKTSLKIRKVAHLKNVFYNWRRRKNSESRTLSPIYISDYFKALDEVHAFVVRNFSSRKFNKLIACFYFCNYLNLLSKLKEYNENNKQPDLKRDLKELMHKSPVGNFDKLTLLKKFPLLSLKMISMKDELFFNFKNKLTARTFAGLSEFFISTINFMLKTFYSILKRE